MSPVQRLDEHRLAIFLFHGVVERCDFEVRNYTHKHLLKDAFHGVIRSLVRAGTPVSMEDVIRHVDEQRPFPPRAFAVTFDDGFENNYSVAAPILADHGVPATFYVTTSFVEHNAMAWIDRIEVCFEAASPGHIRLPWSGGAHTFRTRADRIRILDEIRTRMKADPTINRDAFIGDLFAQCRLNEVHHGRGPLDRKLSWAQVQQLDADPLFTVGGHSHTHATLGLLTEDEMRAEIETSLCLLGDRAGIEPRHYSYPEGLEYCYSPQVIDVLRSFGVCCCPTAIDGLNDQRAELFHLRRIMVDDVSADGRAHANVRRAPKREEAPSGVDAS